MRRALPRRRVAPTWSGRAAGVALCAFAVGSVWLALSQPAQRGAAAALPGQLPAVRGAEPAQAADTAAASGWVVLWAVLWVVLLLADFLTLAVVCDAHLVPAIEVICERFSIPDAVAGASLMAFGSSAPEVMINVAAVAQPEPKIEMSVPALFGSAMIAFAFIPAGCAYCVRGELELDPWPVARDTTYYTVCLIMLVWILNKGMVDAADAAILVCAYVLYMLFLAVPLIRRKKAAEPPLPPPVLSNLSSSTIPVTDGSPSSGHAVGYPEGSVEQSPLYRHRRVSALDMTRRLRGSVVVQPDGTVLRRKGSSVVGLSSRASTRLSSAAYGAVAHTPASRTWSRRSPSPSPREAIRRSDLTNETPEADLQSPPGARDASQNEGAAGDDDAEEVGWLGSVMAVVMLPFERLCDACMLSCLVTVRPAKHMVEIPASKDAAPPGAAGLQQVLGLTMDPASLYAVRVDPEGAAGQSGIREGWRVAAIIDTDALGPSEDGGAGDDESFSDLEEAAAAWDEARAGMHMEFQEPPGNGAVAFVFLLSILYVSLLSALAVVLSEQLASAVHMPRTIAGATVLALGAQVPDTVGSIAMARAGMANGAVANAICSQLINVSLGAGLPFLMFDLLRSRALPVAPSDLSSVLTMAAFLGALIALYVTLCLWRYCTCRPAEQCVVLTAAEYRAISFESPAPLAADGRSRIARVCELPASVAAAGLPIGRSLSALKTARMAAFAPIHGDRPCHLLDRDLPAASRVEVIVPRKGGLTFVPAGAVLLCAFFVAYIAFVVVDWRAHG